MFNLITGPSIKLSEDKLSACRKNPIEEFENGWLFSEKYLNENEEFQIQILHLISSHCQSLQFGITLQNPSDLKQMGLLLQNKIFKNSWMLEADKFYYQNDDNIITTEEYDINLSLLQEGDLIGIKVNEKRELCFTHNGISFRNVADDIPQNTWVFVNLYGKCSFITIIPIKSPITSSQKEKMIKKLKVLKVENVTPHEEDKIYFHSHCGKEVRLSENNHVAQRKNPTNEFRNAVVISNKPLITNKVFKLRIEGLINKWNGSIEFGVTIHNPDSFELPATMTNLRSGTLVLSGNSILTNGHGNQLPYSATSLDDLKIGDEIGVMRNADGDIIFFIDQKDLGIAGNIPIDVDIWVVIDLYGRTIKVAIPNNRPKSPFSTLEDILNLQIQEMNDKLIFHPICGRNVLITQGGYTASRINDQEFNNGVVFTNRPLKIGERWTVKLMRCVEQWAGNLEMGITTLTPNESVLPSTMTDSNIGYTVMLTSNGLVINGCPLSQCKSSLDLENIHSVLLTGISSLIEDSTLGVELIDLDKLQFFINNADLGFITLETDKDIYGVIDLYGKAAEVSIHLRDTPNSILHINANGIKSVSSNINEASEEEIKPNFYNSFFSDDNSDVERHSYHTQSENGLNEMLLDADQSFLRLLASDEAFIDDSKPVDRQALYFHQIHGRNVILSNEGRTAYRPSPNNEFKNALVMSSRPLVTDELFEICVEKMTDHWSGSLEMGVTLIRPEELNFPGTLSQLDKDCWVLSGSCLMNNGITARNDYGLDMDNIHVNSKIGIIRRQSGMLHFLLDGVDMGSAYFDVPTGIYVILDLYGQCSQVSITSKTGINLSSDHVDINVNPLREISNYTRDREEPLFHSSESSKVPSIQYILALGKTMSAIRKNLSFTSGNISDSKWTNMHDDSKIILDDTISATVSDDKNIKINSFFCESIFGVGVTTDGTGNYYTQNQNLNCLIQFKQPLKTNFYYKVLFWNDRNSGYNLEPISFGIISDKISSERYFPDNLTIIKSPSWIINGGRLFMNNVLRCQTFAPTLTRYKNQILVGLYFYDNFNLEIFVDNVSVGKVVTEINEECYLLVNLRGWYNTLIGLEMSPKPSNCMSQSNICFQMPNHSLSDVSDFPTENVTEERLSNDQQVDTTDNVDLEDPLLVSIINELSQLLPFFFIIMHGINTSELIEKIVCSNNDIVLYVRKRLLSKNPTLQFSNQNKIRLEIQNQLIEELSNRFSHLSEIKHMGNSTFEIARALRRRVLWNKVNYDEKKSSFIIPNSCLMVEESKISRLKCGSEFGLCILNQELRSKKSNSYEVQLIFNGLMNDVESKDEINTSLMGLILLDNNHFPNIEDVFRFLMTIPCPKRENLLSNYINNHLELQQFESKAVVFTIDNKCVYLNGKRICQNMPFNIKNATSEEYMSFVLLDSGLEIADIYFTIRKEDVTTSHKVFSQSWIKNSNLIKTIYPTRNMCYYIPFVWLKNQSMAVVTTELRNKPIHINDIPQTNQQDWLEKHYHDGLHKEVTHSEINCSSILNKQDRQCISLLRSFVIKKALTLPDMYFHNTHVDCFCNNCYYPISVGNTDSAKEFRLPFGWVKYNIRLKKDEKCNLSLWKLAYLTVPSGLLHRLLTSDNPKQVLSSYSDSNTTQVAWLKPLTIFDQVPCKSIVVSPWQPLIGCYLNEDDSIKHCTDGLISYFDPLTNSELQSKIALEVRVKSNSYKSMECKIVTENQLEIKRIISKDGEACENKKLVDCGITRPINQKTIWILNGDENTVVISGLLMKI